MTNTESPTNIDNGLAELARTTDHLVGQLPSPLVIRDADDLVAALNNHGLAPYPEGSDYPTGQPVLVVAHQSDTEAGLQVGAWVGDADDGEWIEREEWVVELA